MSRAVDRERKLNREWALKEESRKPKLRPVYPSSSPEQFQADVDKLRLNVKEFQKAFRAGAFKSVLLKGGGGHFEIHGEPRTPRPNLVSNGEWLSLGTTKGRGYRKFRSPERALQLLFAMGVTQVRVEMEHWHPVRVKEWNNKRPDMAERLRFAHEQARVGNLKRREEGKETGGGPVGFVTEHDQGSAREGDFDWPGE
jgi:hypothetical protein